MAAEGDILVLFDLDGVLCSKEDFFPSQGLSTKGPERFRLSSGRWVLVRPGVRDFVTGLKSKYTLGVFSSTSRGNVAEILKGLGLESLFSFVADRTATQLDPEYLAIPEIKAHDTVKNLSVIWKHPYYNRDRKWNSSNTLLIDDSFLKCRFNDPLNVLIVERFCVSSQDQEKMGLEVLAASIDSAVLALRMARAKI